MAKVCSMLPEQQQQQQKISMTPAPQPQAHPPRRLRVREVSSRFMSPVVSSSSSGDLHLPSSSSSSSSTSKCPLPKHGTTVTSSTELFSRHHHHQRSHSAQRRQIELEPLSCADENRLETARSLETPLSGSHSKHHHQHKKNKQQRTSSSIRLLKENGNGNGNGVSDNHHHLSDNHHHLTAARSRPDTPNVVAASHCVDGSHRRMTPRSVVSSSTAAAKLLQMSLSGNCGAENLNLVDISLAPTKQSSNSVVVDQVDRDGIMCNIPCLPNLDLRSSMPEANLFPTMSSTRSCDSWNSIGDSPKVSACHRCLNSQISLHTFSNVTKSVYKPTPSVASKLIPSSLKSSSILLPPHPSYTKLGNGADTNKVRKVSNHTENVHALRMFYNRYLQWRYVNAKAEASMNAQLTTAQKSLHGLSAKISELHDSVENKHTSVGQLKKAEIISNILEAQMPCLDEWSPLEREYSSSISEAIKALQDASLRLPFDGNVRVNIEEIKGALSSASNVLKCVFSLVESFSLKGEEMGGLSSEVTAVFSRERALIEECGDLLTRMHSLQVEECSLRGQLIQLKQIISSDQAREG